MYYSLCIHSADAVQCNIKRRRCAWVCGSRFAKRRPSVCVSGGRCQGLLWRSSRIWLTILLSSSAQPWWLTTSPKSFFLSFFFSLPLSIFSVILFSGSGSPLSCGMAEPEWHCHHATETKHESKAGTLSPKSRLYPTRLEAQKCLGTQM